MERTCDLGGEGWRGGKGGVEENDGTYFSVSVAKKVQER